MADADEAAYRGYAASVEMMLGWFACPAMLRLLADNHQWLAIYYARDAGDWGLAARYRKAAGALRARADALEEANRRPAITGGHA